MRLPLVHFQRILCLLLVLGLAKCNADFKACKAPEAGVIQSYAACVKYRTELVLDPGHGTPDLTKIDARRRDVRSVIDTTPAYKGGFAKAADSQWPPIKAIISKDCSNYSRLADERRILDDQVTRQGTGFPPDWTFVNEGKNLEMRLAGKSCYDRLHDAKILFDGSAEVLSEVDRYLASFDAGEKERKRLYDLAAKRREDEREAAKIETDSPDQVYANTTIMGGGNLTELQKEQNCKIYNGKIVQNWTLQILDVSSFAGRPQLELTVPGQFYKGFQIDSNSVGSWGQYSAAGLRKGQLISIKRAKISQCGSAVIVLSSVSLN